LKRSSAAKKSEATEKEQRPEDELPSELPLVPAKDIVAFPSVILSLHIGLPASVRAIESVMDDHRLVCVVAQSDVEIENPGAEDLYKVGVVCNIIRTLKLPEKRYKVLLQGLVRVKIKKVITKGKFLRATIEPLYEPEDIELTAEHEMLINRIHESLRILVENEQLPEEMLVVSEDLEEPGTLADVIIAHYRLDMPRSQEILEQLDPLERLRMTDAVVTEDLNHFLISENVRSQARDELTKDQREYFLREQLKQIQKELGESEAPTEDLEELKVALKKAKLPAVAEKEATKQLQRLERMPMESSEYALIRTYLEWFADLPWSTRTRERFDLKHSRDVLDEDHYGLDKVKDRILEYLSVRKLKKDSRGPILCFVGPPGVGKTSLGKSIARALNRKFHRISIGGVRDEAEIRGHRRTYVGALPGRIIQGMKHTASSNPVFVLDELDKVGADYRGDPSSALLEVLDPHQNSEFADHYLNVPFNLSQVMFIATANTVDTIPDALLDRLEVISLSGYTTQEKVEIAEKYIVPRQLEENGLEDLGLRFERSSLLLLIESYTREAGVRNLEREIGTLCRKVARKYAESGKTRKRITQEFVKKALGPTRYDPEMDEQVDGIGLVRGLAWTTHGGEIMPIEASVAPGKGGLTLTGRLGEVMQESGRAAMFYARANAEKLGLDPEFYKHYDIHIHVPGGAIPKDGPSAGIAIATALVSVLSGRKISREVAMTGEITLRGNVLQIGGLKEKALAALRYGIRKVIVPYENIKDFEEIPKDQREQIKFIPVKHVGEVLEIALLEKTRASSSRGSLKSKGKTVNSKKEKFL